jgi:transcriptional/translational regulatory protein YebC/TACO1
LEEAYQKACAVHPEISKVMAQRNEQQKLMQGSNIAKAKKHAAVSVVGRQGGSAPQTSLSLRDSIAAAWDSQMGN